MTSPTSLRHVDGRISHHTSDDIDGSADDAPVASEERADPEDELGRLGEQSVVHAHHC